jgi:hypothetical protein
MTDRFDNARLPQRTLKTTGLLGLLSVFLAVSMQRLDWGLGLAIGVSLGMFSLWSLAEGVPRLMQEGGQGSRAMLGLLMVVKLPLYAAVLWWSMTSRFVAPFAVFAGVGYVPAVMTLKILGQQLAGAANPAETGR